MPKKEIKRNYIPCRTITEEEKVKTREKYERTLQKIKQYENREIDKEYTEYDKLNDYSRQCLISTNYFRVLWGNNFIDVPTQDLRFWFYFNYNCFDLASEWQRVRKPDFVEKNRRDTEREQLLLDENKNNEIKVIDTVVKIEPEPKTKEEPKIEKMPIEENNNFLKEKQEHPIYPKRENIVKVNSEKEVVVDDKSVKGKKGKKEKPKQEDTQGSLF